MKADAGSAMRRRKIHLSISCRWMFPFGGSGLFGCLKYKWPHWSQPHMVGLHYNSTRRSHMASGFSHLNTHASGTLVPTFARYHTHCMHNIYNLHMTPLYVVSWKSTVWACLSVLLMKNIKTVWFQAFDKLLQACEKIHADCYASLNCELSTLNKVSAGDLQFIRTNGLMDHVHISF